MRGSGFALRGRRVEGLRGLRVKGFKGSFAGNYTTNSHPPKVNAKAQRGSAGPFFIMGPPVVLIHTNKQTNSAKRHSLTLKPLNPLTLSPHEIPQIRHRQVREAKVGDVEPHGGGEHSDHTDTACEKEEAEQHGA